MVFDVYLLSQLTSLHVVDLMNRSDTLDPMFNLMNLVITEQQFAGIVVFVLGFRLVKYVQAPL